MQKRIAVEDEKHEDGLGKKLKVKLMIYSLGDHYQLFKVSIS